MLHRLEQEPVAITDQLQERGHRRLEVGDQLGPGVGPVGRPQFPPVDAVVRGDSDAITLGAGSNLLVRDGGVRGVLLASERLRLSEALAWFDCTLHQLVDAGDHHIVIGQVQQFGWHDAAALTFWRSQFGQFEALPA